MSAELTPTYRALRDTPEFVGTDGAHIRELAGRSTGVVSHSLAVIAHPPGTAAVEHHHTVADEVYFVWSGAGMIRIDGQERELEPGDSVTIRPGQRHKVWNPGSADLVLVVTCAPAYEVREVVWDE